LRSDILQACCWITFNTYEGPKQQVIEDPRSASVFKLFLVLYDVVLEAAKAINNSTTPLAQRLVVTMRSDDWFAMMRTNTLKQLKRLLLAKQQEAREAALERDRLTGRLFLLSALCDVLRWRRDTVCTSVLGLEHGEASPDVSLGNEAVEQTLLELERAIADHSLSRNTASHMDVYAPSALDVDSNGCAALHASASVCLQGGLATADASEHDQHQQQRQIYQQYQRLSRPLQQQISPPEDPLALFKHLFLQPLYPGVDSMSLPQLLTEYGQLVRQLSVVLQLHEKGLGAHQEGKLQELVLR
jgi:hypothetical protein